MRPCAFLSLLSLSLPSFCAASTIPNPVQISANLTSRPIPNLSALPNLPDKDFSGVAAYTSSVQLQEKPCVAVCVAAMRQLALHHIDADLPEGALTWTHPDYNTVTLWLEPPQGQNHLTVRFALWTLSAAFRDMLSRNNYAQLVFHGVYRRSSVAIVSFLPSRDVPTAVIGARNRTVIQQVIPQLDLSVITATTSANNDSVLFGFDPRNVIVADDSLRAEVDYLPKIIEPRDIYIMIVWTMISMCPYNRDPLSVTQLRVPGPTAVVTSVWNRVPPRRGNQPHVMGGGDLISLLALLLHVLWKDVNRFREMNIKVLDQGSVIAIGSFRAERLSGPSEVSETA
ncbi:MAG: hypothetical protein Q9218_006998 [Villophora microphyllina]